MASDVTIDFNEERERKIDPTKPAEIARLAPAGVKNWLRRTNVGDDLSGTPAPIINWLKDRNVVAESARKGQEGRLIITSRPGASVLDLVKGNLEW